MSVNWCNHYRKENGYSSKNLKRTITWPSNSTSGDLSEDNENTNLKTWAHTHPCPHVHCNFIYKAKIYKKLNYLSIDEWLTKMWYTGILFSHKKEWNFAIFNNMDEHWGHYVMWNMSKKEIPYDFTYMWNLKNKTRFYIENRWLIARGRSGMKRIKKNKLWATK